MKLSQIHRRARSVALAVAALLTVGALGGCSGSGSGAGNAGAGVQDIKVGVLTSLDVAPIYLGKEKGFFAEEGLNVTFEIAQGGAALIPAVVTGQYQFGFSNIVSLMVARDKGLPLQIVQAGSQSTNATPDFSAILVAGNSPMQTAKDLEGKTVALNTLGANGELTVRQSVRKAGGDPAKVNFVELTYPDMVPAITSGKIDAGFSVEPFVTLEEGAGNRVLSWNFLDVGSNTVVGEYFTTETTDPKVVEKFVAAMKKSQTYAQEHPDEVRAIIPTFSDMDPELIKKVVLPVYPEDVNLESAQTMADLALQDGFVKKPVDLGALVR